MVTFIADNTLARLGRWLRILGCDTALDSRSAREILSDAQALSQGRVILGRSPRLGARPELRRIFFEIQSENLDEQLREVARAFPFASANLFSRCTKCNSVLGQSQSALLAPAKVPPRTRAWLDEFRECPACGAVYWQGTHAERIRLFLSKVLENAAQ